MPRWRERAYALITLVFAMATVINGHPRDPAPGRIGHPELQPCSCTRHGKIFVGSENFSSTSLNQNLELGLIISGHAVMSVIAGTFASDFRNGKHRSSA